MLLKFMAPRCSEMTRCSANKRSSLETFMWLIMACFPSFGWMQLLKKFTINWSSAYWSCFLELHRRRQGCRKGKEGLFLYWFCFHVLFFVTVLCIRLFPQIFLSSSLVGNSWSHKWTKIFWKRSIKCFRKKNMTVLFFYAKLFIPLELHLVTLELQCLCLIQILWRWKVNYIILYLFCIHFWSLVLLTVFLSSGSLQLIQRYLGELLAASCLARCAMFKLQ